MARRKKLNKRVVVFLVIVLLILAAGGGILLFRSLPKDPDALAERARTALKDKEYKVAERYFREAIGAEDRPVFFYELAKCLLDAASQPDVPEAKRSEKVRQAFSLLRQAMLRDPNYVDAQKLLVDLYTPGPKGPWLPYIQECDKLLSLIPDDHAAHFKRGMARAAMAQSVPGRYSEPAIEDFRKAIELNNKEPSYWSALAEFYVSLERSEEAEQIYKEALDLIPDSADLHVSYARYLVRRGLEQEALDQIQQAIARAPDSTVGYLALAGYHLNKAEHDKALEALEGAKAADEGEVIVYLAMANAYNRQGQSDKAMEAIRQGLVKVTERLKADAEKTLSAAERRRVLTARTQLYYQLANGLLDAIELQKDRLEELMPEVKASLEQIMRSNPEDPRGAKIAGRVAYLEGRLSEAVRLLEKAHQGLRATDAQVANLLIYLYQRESPGKAEKIIDSYLAVPALAGKPSLLLAKARVLLRYRDYAKALEFVDKALASEPDNAEAKKLKIELQVLAGTLKALPEGLELSPAMLRMILGRSTTLWMDGQKDQAISIAEDLHKRAPEDTLVMQQLLTMYFQAGRMDKARAVLREARALMPDNKMLAAQEKLLDEPDPQKRLEMRMEMADQIEDPLTRLLAKARLYAYADKEDKFVECLQEAAKIDPHSPGIVDHLFRYAIHKEDWATAEEAAKRAAEANLDGVKGGIFRAQLAMSRKQFAKAAEILNQAAKEFPDVKRVKLALGEVHLQMEDYEKAEEAFSAVARSDPSSVPALIGMAKVTAALGKLPEHTDWVLKAHRIAPHNPYVEKAYLDLQEQIASPEEAIKSREKLLEQNPSDLENKYRLGELYLKVDRPGKAEEMFRSIWQQPGVNKLTAARLLSGFYARVGRYNDGIKVLDEMLEKTDDKVAAYSLYGEFLARFDPGQARSAFQKAIDSDPNDERGYLAMARFFAGQEQWAEAANAMQRYLELRPDALSQRKDLVRYLLESGQLSAAGEHLDKILASSPADSEALMLKGVLAMKSGKSELAEQLLTRAIKMNPRSGEGLLYRAMLSRTKGKLNDARRDLAEARRLSNAPRIGMELAAVMRALGDRNGARAIYSEILQESPDFRPAIIRLLRIYLREEDWPAMEALLSDARSRLPKDTTILAFEADMWLARGDNSRALAALESAVTISPDRWQMVRAYLDALLKAGQYEKLSSVADSYKQRPGLVPLVGAIVACGAARQGRTEQADQQFVAALKAARPDQLAFVVSRLSEAYGQAKAAEKLAEWLKTLPASWQMQALLAGLYAEAGEFDKSLAGYQSARALAESDRERALVDRGIGSLYVRAGKFQQAEAAYQAVLKVIPDDTEAMNDLAYIYADVLDDPAKALPYARRIVAAMPTNASVVDTYGWALAKLGKLQEAEEQLVRSVRLSPGAINRYHLGWVYEMKGRLREAETEYGRAYELAQGETDSSLLPVIRKALDQVREKMKAEEL